MNAEKTSIIKMFIKDADNANAKRALVKNIFMNALLSNDVEILEIFVRSPEITKYLNIPLLNRLQSAKAGQPFIAQIRQTYLNQYSVKVKKAKTEFCKICDEIDQKILDSFNPQTK